MLKEDNVRFLLDHYYKGIENTRDNRQDIRKWCLTIWLAVLGIVLTGKITLVSINAYIAVVLPILVFWFFEAITATHTLLLEKRAIKLEEFLIENNSEDDLKRHLFVSGHYYIPLSEKIKCFRGAMIGMETIFLFYTALIVLSIIILLIK